MKAYTIETTFSDTDKTVPLFLVTRSLKKAKEIVENKIKIKGLKVIKKIDESKTSLEYYQYIINPNNNDSIIAYTIFENRMI